MAKRLSAVAALATCAIAIPGAALANGRLPAGHQFAISPVDPSFFVVETAFGVLVSHDTGRTWGWVCENAMGYGFEGGTEDPTLGLMSKSVLAGLSEGLASSTDEGCSWGFSLDEPIIDLVVRRDNPHAALALTSKYSGVGDAGENLYDTRVLATSDDGAHWAPQGIAIDPAIQVETIDVAPSNPSRLYLSGARRQALPEGGVGRVGVVLASSDGGATYTETAVALDPVLEANGAPFIAAVDPMQPDRVYARVRGGAADRLIVSEDAAATFRTIYKGQSYLAGFALSSDGAKIYLGGAVDGMLLAHTSSADGGPDFQFATQSTASIQCLTLAGNVLYGCMGSPQGFYIQQLGASMDDGVTFEPVFRFACLSTALSCAGCGIANACGPSLTSIVANLGICDSDASTAPASDAACAASEGGGVPPDAGTDDAGNGVPDAAGLDAGSHEGDAGPGPPTSTKAACGCGAGEAAGASGALALWLVVPMALRRRYSRSQSER